MASRTKQKEEARARRLAEERRLAEQTRQRRRMQMLAGVVIAAIAVVAVAIAVSVGGGGKSAPKNLASQAAHTTVSPVNSLLTGIPQSATTIGSPSAKVTVTEYGDLQCPVCADFAKTTEKTLISKDVREGRVRLVYKSLDTATGNGPTANMFAPQQAAAYAAGRQNLGWHYILDFYNLQGQEGTSYVTQSFLDGIARLVPGLNFTKWAADRNASTLLQQVNVDEQTAVSLGLRDTPSLLVQGPKGQAQPIAGAVDYNTLEQEIKLVS